MAEPKPLASGPIPRLIVLAIIALVIAVVFLRPPRQNGDEPEPGQLPLAKIAELKNLGVAYLENIDLNPAEQCFVELTTLLPDEQFGWQNLAITQILKIAPENLNRAEKPDQFKQGLIDAQQTVNELLKRFPDDAQPYVISAKLALSVDDHAAAVKSLRQAAALNPDDASVWCGIFESGRYSQDETLIAESNEALKEAWKLAPDNLYLMREWLLVQAQAKDPSITDTLSTARGLVAPLVDRIQKFARVNLNDLIDQGIAGLKESDWSAVTRSAMMTGNVLRPEVATQNDTREVNPHLLEFMVHDFSEQFQANNTLPKPPFPAAIPVSFMSVETPFQNLSDVRQIHAVDFDLNGSLDIVLVQKDQISVWTQSRTRPPVWTEVASLTPSQNGLPAGLSGVCLFDLDRDADVVEHSSGDPKLTCAEADLDILAYGTDGLTILRNELITQGENASRRTLVPVGQNEDFTALKNVLTVLPVDFDHDGDLDLVVSAESGLSLWLNLDDSTFAEHSRYSALPSSAASIHTLIAVDWDRNVSIDVLAFGNQQSGVLKNLLHGQFQWEHFPQGSAFAAPQFSASLLDADSNYSWDVLSISSQSEKPAEGHLTLTTTANPDAGVVQILKSDQLSSAEANGAVTADFDNDGFVDVVTWLGKQLTLHRGGPSAQFEVSEISFSEMPSNIKSCTAAELNQDGGIDLCVACKGSVEVLTNKGGNANNWIDIPIRAEDAKEAQKPSERVNIHGVGSLLELRSGTAYQTQVVTGRTTHFGLGKQKQVDSVRVLWTNGVPEHIVQPKHGEPICMQQHLKGSCPYLYTWDGEKFTFYTDCLWAAPIGLQLAEGVLAPPREWEYLKIDGDRLKSKDGEYVLRLTEELWEIGYFDSVRLLAIDHPSDVDIYSNEKVGPPSISPFKVHTVRHPRTPVSAVDQQGRDILSKIEARDDDFVQCFDRRIKQGLTEPHFLELDLGQLDNPENITLFLTGWIRPTDTSLNIAISQRPDLESTQPPSVHVPDASGNWVKVQPYMGFPGGKTKTIAIDLTGAFLTDDYRVRVATTMEIYWDQAFFTVDEEPAEFRTTEMPLISADLRYRGFSTKISAQGLGPTRYNYQQLDEHKQWPPMEGRLTTYGDVTELISQTDNRQALLGAGDEMEVRFNASITELPIGWKRDFILHNVGWDKDADLNTVFGQSIDPLPFAGMVGYPDPTGPPGQKPFAAQTRQQPRAKFWRAFQKSEQQH